MAKTGPLATYATQKIQMDFPVNQDQPSSLLLTNILTPDTFDAAMTAALANRSGRDTKDSASLIPKLPSHKFGGLLPLLLKVCEVTKKTLLPPLYYDLANCFKHEQSQVIQHHFTIGAAHETVEHMQIPVATRQLYHTLMT